MTAPGDSETTPERREEEQEIVLRLGDILTRVPAHLLKPGPHDTMSHVRFSVDELAEKISRGRVSVPLERLASVCPEVFRDSDAFPGEQEIQLPLQKLLEQVGLVAPKPPSPSGIPKEQLDQARAEAGRIIEAASTPPPVGTPRPTISVPPEAIQQSSAKAPSAQPARTAKLPLARQLLGLFKRSDNSKAPTTAAEEAAIEKPVLEEKKTPGQISEKMPDAAQATRIPDSAPKTPAQPVPAGCISLRVLPIFRLLPAEVLRPGPPPSEEARAILPLSAIDSQLAGGHVEIPLADFIKALPEDLRETVNPIPETQVWIPLDEIFQSLPTDHLFYMPPLDPIPEPATPTPQAPPLAEPGATPTETPPASAEPAKSTEPPVIDHAQEPAHPEVPPVSETPLKQETAPAQETLPEPSPQPVPVAQEAAPEAAAPPAPVSKALALSAPPEATAPAQEEKSESVPAPTPQSTEASSPTPPAQPTPEPAPASHPPSRAPWMRGFQVPPPRLFSGDGAPADAPVESAPVDSAPPPAPTPEAMRTAEFLASQPGVFAAAAFVQGAVFASADFPRKPDLDALRDFMGYFVDQACESGRRLGWNRIVTITCEQLHATAVVRDTHFIVALHHDRTLPTLAYDALISAADDLNNPSVQQTGE